MCFFSSKSSRTKIPSPNFVSRGIKEALCRIFFSANVLSRFHLDWLDSWGGKPLICEEVHLSHRLTTALVGYRGDVHLGAKNAQFGLKLLEVSSYFIPTLSLLFIIQSSLTLRCCQILGFWLVIPDT